MAIRFDKEDTIVALATPAGTGAIAMIRLSGSEAIEIAEKIFRLKGDKKKKVSSFKSHTIHFGVIHEDEHDIDEVLLYVFRAPNSYTVEDVIEISCHGSAYIQQRIIQLAVSNGARMEREGKCT